ncbi:hypothetical protein CTI12_AA158480 [Artemisia annua]|uniref:Uncharacterized protein n=1 Tax=Artemisia annua TaxID=35608 RepID=A0A2U1PDT5_ARTAN|nr:hypothetical protein CTI12_AA158480 [Artemisia annua]
MMVTIRPPPDPDPSIKDFSFIVEIGGLGIKIPLSSMTNSNGANKIGTQYRNQDSELLLPSDEAPYFDADSVICRMVLYAPNARDSGVRIT